MINFVSDGKTISAACSSPVTPASGNAVRIGNLTGVAVTAEGDGGNASTEATVYLDRGIFSLSVTDSVGGGIAIGDSLFLADGAPPVISNLSTGYFFGTALAAVGVGATATIDVLKAESPASGALGAGAVGAVNLAAGAAKANLTGANVATSAELDPTTIQYATVSLTNAEIKGLRGAPKQLVAAPGATKTLEFISAVCFLDYGSNVLTRPNADEDLIVHYDNLAGLAASEPSIATFPVHNADAVTVLNAAASALFTAAGTTNKALVLCNDGTAEFGGNAANDTLMRVKVAYRVHVHGF